MQAHECVLVACGRHLIVNLARLVSDYYGGFRGRVVEATRFDHKSRPRPAFRVLPNELMFWFGDDEDQTLIPYDELSKQRHVCLTAGPMLTLAPSLEWGTVSAVAISASPEGYVAVASWRNPECLRLTVYQERNGSYHTIVSWRPVCGIIRELAISGSTLYATDDEDIFCTTILIPSTAAARHGSEEALWPQWRSATDHVFEDVTTGGTPMVPRPIRGAAARLRLRFVHMVCANNRLYATAFVNTVDIGVYRHNQTIDQHKSGPLSVGENQWEKVIHVPLEYPAGLTASVDGELTLWTVNRHYRGEDGDGKAVFTYASSDRKLKRRRIPTCGGKTELVLCEDPFPGQALQYHADLSVYSHPQHHDRFIVIAAHSHRSIVAIYQ
jgi:hypothetical protein